MTVEAYGWEVEPSVQIQKSLSEEVTYKWGCEKCAGDSQQKTEDSVFCAKGTGLWKRQT